MRIALLHGFLGDPQIWDETIAAWPREGDDFVRPALPGHGGRESVWGTWDGNLAVVASAIGNADIVVGYSLGGRLALGLVATGRVTRAILVSTNPGLDDAAREERRAADAEWASILREKGIIPFLDVWEAQPLFATRMRAKLSAREGRRARRLSLDAEQMARSLEVMGLAQMPDYRGILDERFAMIVGADDAKYVAIAHRSPCRRVVIADSGHDVTLEQPAALADAIVRLAGR